MLNELEYVDGFIYANVYQTDFIVKIDAESGHVVGRINMTGLLKGSDIVSERTDVLNGIAYDSDTKLFYVTGKRWPKMFELKLN
jgi:glutamine cyclotransferase